MLATANAIGVPFTKLNTDEMTYPVQTINLAAGVEYDITTTISSTQNIYNVLVETSTGEDITETVERRWAASGGVWHVYIESSTTEAGIKIKIIYK